MSCRVIARMKRQGRERMTDKWTMLIAAHKKSELPDDALYLPVHVGRAIAESDLGYQGDDEGDNISSLNRSYCELTGLYWA